MQLQTEVDANERLVALVDSSFDAIISKDLNSIIQSWNTAAERLFGYSADEAVGRSIMMLIPDKLQGEEAEIIARIRAGERVASYETVRRRKDGSLVAVSLTISPIRNRLGQIVGASKIARDITVAKENEQRIRLLMREVNHRTKNQFAVILSMVRETMRRTTNPQEFEARIRDRITALSRSHDLLVTTDWVGATLFDLIHEHLKPFGHEKQIRLSGPLVTIGPNSVQHFGIAIHELGTNSAKYGALASDTGEVAIGWRVAETTEGKSQFEFEWIETSSQAAGFGATVAGGPNENSGFGSVVLKRVVPQSVSGTATLERDSAGVRWRLVAPLQNIVAPDVSELMATDRIGTLSDRAG